VRGKRVVDFATGSGLVGIAAVRAGAQEVEAVDVDALAIAACRLNARANGVALRVRCADPVGDRLDGVDVVLAGDVWYEAEAARRFVGWFTALARSPNRTRVLTGDPGRTYAPTATAPRDVATLASFEVPTPLDLEGTATRRTAVLEFVAPAAARADESASLSAADRAAAPSRRGRG
jgi:predicted nicotinamide N-methyase